MQYVQTQLEESESVLVIRTTPHRDGLRFGLGWLIGTGLMIAVLGWLFFPTSSMLKCSRVERDCYLSQTSAFVLKTEERIALQDIRGVTIDAFQLEDTPRFDVSFQSDEGSLIVATFGNQTQAEALQRDLQAYLSQPERQLIEYLQRDVLYWQIAGVFLGVLFLIFLVLRVILYKGHWQLDKQTKQLSGQRGFRPIQADLGKITRVYLKPLRNPNFGETTFELKLSVSGSRPLSLATGLGRDEARQTAEKLRIFLGFDAGSDVRS